MGEIKRSDQAIGAIEQLAIQCPPNVGIYVYILYIRWNATAGTCANHSHILYKYHAVWKARPFSIHRTQLNCESLITVNDFNKLSSLMLSFLAPASFFSLARIWPFLAFFTFFTFFSLGLGHNNCSEILEQHHQCKTCMS